MRMQSYVKSLAIACAVTTTPCLAQVRQIGPDRYAMSVRHADRPSTTRAAVRRVLERIDAAALEVCGASSFSLREVRSAMRRSSCWRDAMTGAMAQVDDPLVSATHRKRMGN